MDDIARWSASDRADLILETAARKGINRAIVEKDFWVCWILGKLFEADWFKDILLFKGGTSLSKVFSLIERFSEDVDLVLDKEVVASANLQAERSNKQQQKLNEYLRTRTRGFLRDSFLPELSQLINPICQAELDSKNAQVIRVKYPASFSLDYLRPELLLEIGILSAWMPNSRFVITPYLADEFPDQFRVASCSVRTIKAERTFWEKATILHHEANRPVSNTVPPRLSRHYYDLMMMAKSPIRDSALLDLDLLYDVVDFKQKRYYRAWARYEEAIPGTFKLIPPKHIRSAMEDDYRNMQAMIFGVVPTFDDIIDVLADLEREINALEA